MPSNAGHTDSEKYAKLAAMEAYDQYLLAADGYKATARLDYGNCNGGPADRTRRSRLALSRHLDLHCLYLTGARVTLSAQRRAARAYLRAASLACRTTAPIPNSPHWRAPPCRRTKPTRRKPVKTWTPVNAGIVTTRWRRTIRIHARVRTGGSRSRSARNRNGKPMWRDGKSSLDP